MSPPLERGGAVNIFVLGATGLVGRAVCQRLLALGHRVTGFGNVPPAPGDMPDLQWCAGDFSRRTRARHWRTELPGVDVVINTIGVFDERFLHSFHILHDEAPAALWAACVSHDVKRAIHLSALGAADDAVTDYWRSKARGEASLLAQTDLESWIVRPALIYADSGRSASLFRSLAALPVLPVPAGAGDQQPVHLDDVADLIVALAEGRGPVEPRIVAAVGPQAMPCADWLRVLRQSMGLPAAPLLRIPAAIADGLAWVAECRAGSLITRDSLRMLRVGCVGTPGDAEQVSALIGRPLLAPKHFANPSLRADAVLAHWQPVLCWSIAFVWLFTAFLSLWQSPAGLQLLADFGLPSSWQWPALLAGAGLDALLGVLALWRPSRRLWQLQIVVVLTYTLLITVFLPQWWLHPFGPISKNIPLLSLLGLCAALEKR